jgi:Flp pilus assembly protein TadB
MRSREELRRAASVATAQARATGRMVTGMPAFGVGALWLLDRSGFGLVLGSPLGWAALLGSAILAAAGHLLIRRIAAIEA